MSSAEIFAEVDRGAPADDAVAYDILETAEIVAGDLGQIQLPVLDELLHLLLSLGGIDWWASRGVTRVIR